MIVIEPFDFSLGHDGGIEKTEVKREKCQGFELVEVAEIVGQGGNGQHKVLAAYAMLPFNVETGLVEVIMPGSRGTFTWFRRML